MGTDDDSTRPERPRHDIDAHSLRGLAHPLRVKLLELLQNEGPATNNMLSERLGEKPGTVSWHLRKLAEHGFIEEEVDRGTKRERWWRTSLHGYDLGAEKYLELRENPELRAPLDAFVQAIIQHQFARAAHALDQPVEPEWIRGTLAHDWGMELTAQQMKQLGDDLTAVLDRYSEAARAAPEPGAKPVVFQVQGFRRPDQPEVTE
jgi:DNA-binding transcriptional ArsR family regulator